MGLTTQLTKLPYPFGFFGKARKFGLTHGKLMGRLRKWIFGGSNSARSYQNLNGTYGTANNYHLDSRYRSLAELTGTK